MLEKFIIIIVVIVAVVIPVVYLVYCGRWEQGSLGVSRPAALECVRAALEPGTRVREQGPRDL